MAIKKSIFATVVVTRESPLNPNIPAIIAIAKNIIPNWINIYVLHISNYKTLVVLSECMFIKTVCVHYV